MSPRFQLTTAWDPPTSWPRIQTIDAHTAGEPLRIVVGGMADIPGETILEKRRYVQAHLDHLRRALMWEPRGHADMYGCIITPPVTGEADFGVLFLHNEGLSTMCGHGIIAVTKVVLETGMMPIESPESKVAIDTPAGLVTAYAQIEKGGVKSVYFQNIPSFVVALDERVNVSGLGSIAYDLAFGGAFYAYVQAEQIGLPLLPERIHSLIDAGMAIKRTIAEHTEISHPFEPDLNFLYGTIFTGPPLSPGVDSRNVCIFAEGEVDRSPTGTGVSARMAIHHERGDIAPNQKRVFESIIGTRLSARVVDCLQYGPHEAVIPEVEGCAYVTGRHEFLIDPDDPLKHGFILR